MNLTSYASASLENFSLACGSSWFVSGWYFFASCRTTNVVIASLELQDLRNKVNMVKVRSFVLPTFTAQSSHSLKSGPWLLTPSTVNKALLCYFYRLVSHVCFRSYQRPYCFENHKLQYVEKKRQAVTELSSRFVTRTTCRK